MKDQMELYRCQFCQEALEILDNANNDILKAEADPDNTELLNSIFRGIHTIKGSAGTFGLGDVSAFAHHLEALLSTLRDGLCTLTPEITDIALRAMDVLSAMISGHTKNSPVAVDEGVIEEINAKISGFNNNDKHVMAQGKSHHQVTTTQLPDFVLQKMKPYITQGLNVYNIHFRYTDDVFGNGYDQMVLMANLRSSCSAYVPLSSIEALPTLAEFNPLSLYLHPVIYVATAMNMEELVDLAFDQTLISIEQFQFSGTFVESPLKIIATTSLESQVLHEFIISAQESLCSLEESMLQFEKNGAQAALKNIFRTIHNIKGDANYVGFTELVPFIHDIESVLEGLKNGTFSSTKETTDIILSAIDGLKSIVGALANGKKEVSLPNVSNVISEHLALLCSKQSSTLDSDKPGRKLPVPLSFIDQISQYRDILSCYIKQDLQAGNVRKIINRALRSLYSAGVYVKCETVQAFARDALQAYEQSDIPKLERTISDIIALVRGMTEESKRIGEILVEDGKITHDDVQQALTQQHNLGQILIAGGKVNQCDIDVAVRKQDLMEIGRQLRPDAEEKQNEIRTMRVDESKIEHFANMLGEMVVARNTYEYIIGQLTQDLASPEKLKPLKENLHLFSRITSEMQTGVMAMRMVPIKSVFVKFQRVVRDIGRKQSKDIDLIISGGETEIDKKVADMLSEPLVHMVRNSCDHGIEPRVQRIKAGKTERGTIQLSASQEGRNIIIKIIDDGQGLDRNRIYEKAVKMGLNPCPPYDDKIFQFVFHPGLSTKTEVSDISGRGVGMDVVRSTIKMLNGEIDIASEEEKGTEITLTLPMAIGISTALTILAGRQQYAIPFDYVLETLKVRSQLLHKANGRQIIHYRGKVITVEHLSNLFKYIAGVSSGIPEFTSDATEIPLVMLKTSQGMFGVIVDKLERNLEIAIKPVPPQLAHVQVISGVTIMGDGKVLLVLNPEKLFDYESINKGRDSAIQKNNKYSEELLV